MNCFPSLTLRLPGLTEPHSLDLLWARKHTTYGSWVARFTLCNFDGDLKPLLEQSIEMVDEHDNVCWCGYIDEAYRCCGDYMAWGWSSQNILNSVAVSYTVGIEARRTTFVQDLNSIAVYGKREAVIALPPSTLWPTPELYAARILATFANPQPVLHNTYQCDCGLVYLHATGLWRTLAWQRYEDACGFIDAAPGGVTAHSFGVGFTSNEIGFSSEGYIGSLSDQLNAFPNGETIVVSGASEGGNNQVAEVTKHVGKVISYTTNGLNMDPDDDIRDTHNHMNQFATNQMLCLPATLLDGTPILNAGCHFIKRVLSDGSRVEVHGGDIVNESLVGEDVTINSGVSIQIDPGGDHEYPGALVTMLSYSQIVCQTICNSCANQTTINRVILKLRKHGTPTDGVQVMLSAGCTVAGEIAVVDASLLANSFDWFTVDFAIGQTLAPGACAFVRIERTGDPDTANYFELASDSDTALTYAQVSPDGIQWRDAGYAVALQGVATIQIGDLVAQLLHSWLDVNAINLSPAATTIAFRVPGYRAGSQSLLYELEQLLALGDPQGKRLVMTIDCNGNVTVDAEPEPQTSTVVDCNGYPNMAVCQLATGQWIRSPADLNDVDPVFLDWYELNATGRDCRARYVERDFTLQDLGYTLHWNGV